MSVVAPAVYVGTWHKYNCGSIAGRWFDLTTFDDERDFFAACRALHQDETDPELMFQDYECVFRSIRSRIGIEVRSAIRI
ncbi:antirestriction protein ArdA, partial [Escherichia coli]